MDAIFDEPFLLFLLSFSGLWLAAFCGARAQKIWRPLRDDEQEEFKVAQAAAFTLLGLIIGFSFSMSVGRYDARKTLEESEANAIGTEYVRADLAPEAAAAKLKAQLRDYLAARIADYSNRDEALDKEIAAKTMNLQAEIWATVRTAAAAQPTPIVSLVVAGANDVLNAQGYVQAAWTNRIPPAAWRLLFLIAIACNLLLGYGAQRLNAVLFLVVPVAVSISFLLIAEIDSPRGGLIRVKPANLVILAASLDKMAP